MSPRSARHHVAEYHFARGALRGTQFTLLDARLLHVGADRAESILLDAISSVRIAFERNARRIGWGAGLCLVALIVFALAGPLRTLVAHGLAEVMAQIARDGAPASPLAQFLEASLRALGVVAGAMPVAALALALWGTALVVTGWIGHTSLVLVLPSAEREFLVPGRDLALTDFAENLAERIAAPDRP